MEIPRAQVRAPRPSASVMLRKGEEILVCHRVSEVPAFPDYWAFPGGGVSRVDKAILERHPEWFPGRDEAERAALTALLREMVEDVGIAPTKNGLGIVNASLREAILEDKAEWGAAVERGELQVNCDDFLVISERITPPLAPLRFHNHFFTIECEINPVLPQGRAEFHDYRWATPAKLLEEWENHEIKIPPPLIMMLRDLVGAPLAEQIEWMVADPPRENKRIEFAPGVECLPLPTTTLPPATHTNCYVLGQPGGERVIIDPAAKDVEGLAQLQTKIGAILEDGSTIISTIFTHRHTDHIGDLEAISQLYSAPIWASKETLEVIPDSETNIVLKEGDAFTLNGPNGAVKWDVIITPGHCPGQLCLVGDAGIVSADNAVQVGTILVPSGEGDMTAYIQGLYRLRDLNPKLLFSGHGPVVTNPRRLLTQYIEHREKRHAAVLEAVNQGISNVQEIADLAYADTPDAHPMLKLDQTQSHLEALTREGKING